PSGPEIQVLDGTADIADGTGSVSFGSTPAGTPISKTFTVKNVGTTTLNLTSTPTVPSGFTVTSSYPINTTVAPGSTASFTVRLDAAANGTYSGQLSFGNDDSDENPFNFNITGTVAATPVLLIIHDGQTGFSTVGSWTYENYQGYTGDEYNTAAGTGS